MVIECQFTLCWLHTNMQEFLSGVIVLIFMAFTAYNTEWRLTAFSAKLPPLQRTQHFNILKYVHLKKREKNPIWRQGVFASLT